ncbi:2Fe-2S iron-sulfur cluster-binding protein [Flavobacteriales bacterium]|nr:2Fe-2S iron-sulfur cluster-binding protein [Flavobacteriales bacterium]
MDSISINIIDFDGKKHAIETPINPDSNLMEILKEEGFSMGHCGGMALCASCHCYVEYDQKVTLISSEEESMLDQLHNLNITQSRLICQIPCSKEVDGITIRMVRN